MALDLTHALACEVERPAGLLERPRLRIVEAVAEDEHGALALRERPERTGEGLAAERDLDLLVGLQALARHEVAAHGVLGLSDRLIEARRRMRRRLHLARLLDGEACLLGDLLERGLSAELRPEDALGLVELLETLDDVHRHADRAGLVRKRPGHSLADPPGGVRRELVAAAPVELLDRADEPQRALLDQVQEGQALVPVVLRDRHDEAQVRLDHPLLRLHVAALDPLGELDLLSGGQERVTAGLAQEELERVGRRLVDGRLRRRLRRLFGLWGLLDDVDAALLELALERLALHLVQLQRLENLCQLGVPDCARLLGNLEQVAQILAAEDRLDLSRRHPASCLSPNTGDAKLVRSISRRAGASLYRIPHRCWKTYAREQTLCQVASDPTAGPAPSPSPVQSYPQVGRIAVECGKKKRVQRARNCSGEGLAPCGRRP